MDQYLRKNGKKVIFKRIKEQYSGFDVHVQLKYKNVHDHKSLSHTNHVSNSLNDPSNQS